MSDQQFRDASKLEYAGLLRENADLRAHLAQLQQEKDQLQQTTKTKERNMLTVLVSQWFQQGGYQRFGALDTPLDAPELIAAILHRMSLHTEAAEDALVQCQQERDEWKQQFDLVKENGLYNWKQQFETTQTKLAASEQDRVRLRAVEERCSVIEQAWRHKSRGYSPWDDAADELLEALVGEPPPPEKENS